MKLMKLVFKNMFILVKHIVIMWTILCVEFTFVMQNRIHYCKLEFSKNNNLACTTNRN